MDFAVEYPALVDREITVFTVDGKATKGVVKKISTELVALETEKGTFMILGHAIVSLYVSKEVLSKM
jgi:sRNA-binding regulator protein Hfq